MRIFTTRADPGVAEVLSASCPDCPPSELAHSLRRSAEYDMSELTQAERGIIAQSPFGDMFSCDMLCEALGSEINNTGTPADLELFSEAMRELLTFFIRLSKCPNVSHRGRAENLCVRISEPSSASKTVSHTSNVSH